METNKNGVTEANVGWIYVITAQEKGALVSLSIGSFLFIHSLIHSFTECLLGQALSHVLEIWK